MILAVGWGQKKWSRYTPDTFASFPQPIQAIESTYMLHRVLEDVWHVVWKSCLRICASKHIMIKNVLHSWQKSDTCNENTTDSKTKITNMWTESWLKVFLPKLSEGFGIICHFSLSYRANWYHSIKQRRVEGENVRSVTENQKFLHVIGLLISDILKGILCHLYDKSIMSFII